MSLIVNFTPTGMVPTKAMTPHVPLRIDEIIDEVQQAVQIGITMVHLHARDPATGLPTSCPATYGAIIQGIRQFAPDLVVCVSLSGRQAREFDQRAAPLRLEGSVKPDMGSLTLSSLNFVREASQNAPEMIQALAAEMLRRGIVPELEAFDVGMLHYAKYLEKKGLIRPPHYVNLILGNLASAQANLLHAGLLVNDLPAGALWSLGGIGAAQTPMNAVAVALGGGVRVGLEDNFWYDAGRTRLATNAALLRRIHHLAEIHGRPVMPPSELRRRLDLTPGFGTYGRRAATDSFATSAPPSSR